MHDKLVCGIPTYVYEYVGKTIGVVVAGVLLVLVIFCGIYLFNVFTEIRSSR